MEALEPRLTLAGAVLPPADLVSWYRAEGDAVDSAYSNDGTLVSGATFAAGKVGQAFSFDGLDDEVRVPHNPNQNTGNQITIEAWVNPDTLDHGRPIAQKRSASNVGGFTFETTDSSIPGEPENGLQFVIWLGDFANFRRLATPADALMIGQWQHVAATYDGATMRIYVNGVELAIRDDLSGFITPTTDPLVIGRNVVIPSFAWDGLIDEFGYYSRALSQAEIQAIVDAGSDGKDPDAVVFRADFERAETSIHHADFEGVVDSTWSSTATDVTPLGNHRFLGQFGNDAVSLTLPAASIPTGTTEVTLSFELLVIRTWDGNHDGSGSGPDRWTLTTNGTTLVDTTFSNNHPNTGFAGQAYPGAFGSGQFNPRTGASENDTLGFTFPGVDVMDSVYEMEFTIPYLGSDVIFTFSGFLTTPGSDESWGLDNVEVNATSQVPSQFSGVTNITGVQGFSAYGFSGDMLRNDSSPAQRTVLTLTDLPPHDEIDLRFLLAVIDSWDGDQKPGQSFAPDQFSVTVDGNVTFSQTFVNSTSTQNTQNYDPPPGVTLARYRPLGFNQDHPDYNDSAYNLSLDPIFQNIPHTASTLTVEWLAGGTGFEGGINESWGIDNVEVVLRGSGVGEPTTANLEVTIGDSPDPVLIGDSVTYTVTATNQGPADATGVAIAFHGPAGQPFNSVTIPVGVLPSGASSTFQVVFTPSAMGTFSVLAIVTANEDDPDSTNNTFVENTLVAPRTTFELEQARYEVREGEPFAVLTVRRTGDLASNGSIEFNTIDGTSSQRGIRAGLSRVDDFTTTSGTLFFRSRSNVANIRVPIGDDSFLEQDETFRVELSNPSAGAVLGAISSAEVVIHDNDPTLSFFATSSERSESVTSRGSIEVRLHPASNRPVNVAYAVTGGTATPGVDYGLIGNSLTFRPGETRKFINFNTINDTLYEGDETAIIELSSPTNAFLGARSRYRITIVDNDEPPPPVDPGSTFDTALFIDLQTLPRQSYRQLVARASNGAADLDTFRVHLYADEAVLLDVDPEGNPAFGLPGISNSTLTVFGSDGITPDIRQLASANRSAEPDTGVATNNAALLFRAPAEGDYYLQLQTNVNGFFGYRLHFHRIGVSENVPSPELLSASGPMFAWFDSATSTVGITGPTGYGFTLEGPWQQTTTFNRRSGLTSQGLTMPSGSRFTMRSPQGVELPLLANGTIFIRTKANRFGNTVGVVDTTNTNDAISFPVAIDIVPLNNLLEDVFGSTFATVGLLAGDWRISLGGDVFNVAGTVFDDTDKIDQLLPGVPYLRRFGNALVDARLGGLSLDYNNVPVHWIFDPADPMLLVKVPPVPQDPRTAGPLKKAALGASLHGLLRFRPQDPPDPEVEAGVTEFAGHMYATAKVALKIGPVPVEVEADQVLNVDADRDGRVLGDLGDIADVFNVIQGDFSEVREILDDIQLGANGTAIVAAPAKKPDGEPGPKMEAGRASLVLNGLTETVWIRGQQGGKAFPGSPIEVGGASIVMEGLIDFSGDFLIIQTVNTNAAGIELEYEFRISDEGISARVAGRAEWSARIDYGAGTVSGKAIAEFEANIAIEIDDDGDVHLSGSVSASGKLRYSGNTLFSGSIESRVRSRGFRFRFPRGVGSIDLDLFN